jgi:hypothetical protein
VAAVAAPVAGLRTMDKVLAIVAAVASLAGLAAVLYLKFGLPDSAAT